MAPPDSSDSNEFRLAQLKIREAELKLRAAQLVLASAIIAALGAPLVRAASDHSLTISTPTFLLSGHATFAFFLHATQALAIACFLYWHRKWLADTAGKLREEVAKSPTLRDSTGRATIAEQTLEQFTLGWKWMWRGWLFLYLWFTVAALTPLAQVRWVECVSDACDVLSGYAIWVCYLSLEVRSVPIRGDARRNRPFVKAVILLGVAGAACIALSIVDRINDAGLFGVVLVGLFNALALAAFAGRVGSHYIGTERWAVMLIYVYAMVQIFYSLLPVLTTLKTAVWTAAVYIGALLLKAVLFYSGRNMMRHGGLIRYLEAAQSGLLNPKELGRGRWEAVIKAAAGSNS